MMPIFDNDNPTENPVPENQRELVRQLTEEDRSFTPAELEFVEAIARQIDAGTPLTREQFAQANDIADRTSLDPDRYTGLG